MNISMSVGTYNSNLYGLYVDDINLVANIVVNETYVYNPLLTSPLTAFGSLNKLVGAPKSTPDPSYHPSNNSQIGSAQLGHSIYFPSQTWVNYSMIFEFTYTPDPVVGLLRDPTVLELADVCGITSRTKADGNRNLRIHYVATSSLPSLKALGFNPQLSNDLFIRCPFSSDQINAVVSEVQSGVSVFQAIRDVFEGGSGVVGQNATNSTGGTSVTNPAPPAAIDGGNNNGVPFLPDADSVGSGDNGSGWSPVNPLPDDGGNVVSVTAVAPLTPTSPDMPSSTSEILALTHEIVSTSRASSTPPTSLPSGSSPPPVTSPPPATSSISAPLVPQVTTPFSASSLSTIGQVSNTSSPSPITPPPPEPTSTSTVALNSTAPSASLPAPVPQPEPDTISSAQTKSDTITQAQATSSTQPTTASIDNMMSCTSFGQRACRNQCVCGYAFGPDLLWSCTSGVIC
ncbi:hypothetical protein BC830DRAFT_1131586 [Chytriomyces sp. MP71]|nr:hypothetical protein BC830DRAFT_1131586 [Chytriomyces sp. MP71]